MTTYWCEWAWLPDGLAGSVVLDEEDGRWVDVRAGSRTEADVVWTGLVVPGFANCHSHAFHRVLRGQTHGDGGTFWTWRERMYAVAARLTPENYERLARAVFAEMTLSGMVAVGEFHYVHHRFDGSAYDDVNAMGEALKRAARSAGIRLTLLDTCYLHGGLDETGHLPLSEGQRRFSDGSAQAWASRHAQLEADDNTVIGAAIHSVRALTPDDIAVVAQGSRHQPLHAHVSEQPAENSATEAFYGSTPVAVLTGAGAVSDRFSAVHATHLTATDRAALAAAGATACFCPTTERDLADGIGPARELADDGVRLSLGSDQHAVIDMCEEMRALEMNERLATNRRGRFTPAQLLDAATAHDTIGWSDAGRLMPGNRADAVVIDTSTVRTAGSRPQQALMAATSADIRHVLAGGVPVVTDRVHRLGDVAALLDEAIELFQETA